MTPGGTVRPDRHALLELDALLERVEQLARDGDRNRYDSHDVYRWALHRLWISIGNEALAYCSVRDLDVDLVWRMTQLRAGSLRTQVRAVLR